MGHHDRPAGDEVGRRTGPVDMWTASVKRPAAPLDTAIERIWVVRGPRPFGSVHVPPAPVVQLVFNLGDPYELGGVRCSDVWLEGVWEGPIATAATGSTHLVGLQLHPWGAVSLLGGVVASIAGQCVDAETVLGRELRGVRDRLGEASSDGARIAFLEGYMATRLRDRNRDAESVMRLVTASGGRASIEEIAQRVGVDVRTVRRQCERAIGLSPKRLARLVRFDRSVAGLSGRTTVAWSDFAQIHGFYDQSHMIREWRSLLGLSPPEFMSRRAAFGQYVVPVPPSPQMSDSSKAIVRRP